MKILALTRYDPAGASSRYRVYQHLPHMRRAGVEVDEAPLVDERYIERIYRGERKRPLDLVKAALRRAGNVLRARRYDLVWMEKELVPYAPPLLERIIVGLGVPLVVDYDDAIFHKYDLHRRALVRGLLGRKIDHVMSLASLVVAGNAYLAERARAAGAKRVEILPTVIDLDRYPPPERVAHAGLTVGWIGSPSTQAYLHLVAPALARFCASSSARLHAIGVKEDFSLDGVPITRVPWSAEGEHAALSALDIGIMPLRDSPWERGKCGFKIIQYMGCGLPVIASPVGVNREIVLEGETGLLAKGPEEWLAALERLAASPGLRQRMGAAGRARVEERYSLQVATPRLLALLRSVVAAPLGRRPAS